MTELPMNPPPEPLEDAYWAAILQSEDADCRDSSLFFAEEDDATGAGCEVNGRKVDWERICSLRAEETVLDCQIEGHNRGGLLAAGEEVCGFVPVSHLVDFPACSGEEERTERLKAYLGRRLRLKIIESDKARGRIVLSERAALAAPGERQRLFRELGAGQRMCGCVTNITKFGVFVDLGGVEGLVHISEISWGRVSDPQRFLALGEKIDVVVLNQDETRGRVSLSMKRLAPNPWERAAECFPVGACLEGEVTEVAAFGIFVCLGEGLEGLIHKSELAESIAAADRPQAGDRMKVEVLAVDPERQRLSLRPATAQS